MSLPSANVFFVLKQKTPLEAEAGLSSRWIDLLVRCFDTHELQMPCLGGASTLSWFWFWSGKQSQPTLNLGRIAASLAQFSWVQFVSSHATGAWTLWSDPMSPLPLIQARLLRAQRLAAAQKLMAKTSLKK